MKNWPVVLVAVVAISIFSGMTWYFATQEGRQAVTTAEFSMKAHAASSAIEELDHSTLASDVVFGMREIEAQRLLRESEGLARTNMDRMVHQNLEFLLSNVRLKRARRMAALAGIR